MKVGVVDYGMGNLRSVAKALETTGAATFVADQERLLSSADLLVVPGVGAFDAAMANLRRQKLVRFIQDWVKADKPYLGICLGLQLLFDSSEEAPGVRGLGLLAGRVKKFRPASPKLKVPHMGWNMAAPRRGSGGPSLSVLPGYYYFVHSFHAEPQDRSVVWTTTPYGRPFCSAVAQGNLRATQFHPEKSGTNGLSLLRAVLKTFSQKGDVS